MHRKGNDSDFAGYPASLFILFFICHQQNVSGEKTFILSTKSSFFFLAIKNYIESHFKRPSCKFRCRISGLFGSRCIFDRIYGLFDNRISGRISWCHIYYPAHSQPDTDYKKAGLCQISDQLDIRFITFADILVPLPFTFTLFINSALGNILKVCGPWVTRSRRRAGPPSLP